MPKLTIGEYSSTHYDGIHATIGRSFAVAHTSVEHANCYGGGKMQTDTTLSICLNKDAVLTVKATFPIYGKLNLDDLPKSFVDGLTATKRKHLGMIYSSEWWLLKAAAFPGAGINASFTVKDDSDKAGIIVNVHGNRAIGTLRAFDTHMLARVMEIGIGTIIQSECNELIAESEAAAVAELKASKKAA